jgi:hypothetical protein
MGILSMTAEVKVRRQTCTDHCSACGRHFHGLAAFDAHLHRVGEGINAHGARTYELEHLDGGEAGLEAWTTSGDCDLATPEQSGITVWRLPMSEKDRERLAKLAGKAGSGRGSSAGGAGTDDAL